MKKVILKVLIGIVLATLMSCKKAGNPYKDLPPEQLRERLSERYEEIQLLAKPVDCADPDEWRITEISSVCGHAHIAYHESVDEKKLNSLIKDYDQLVEIYAPLVAPVINCAPPYRGNPIGVQCVDGDAIVQYDE